MVLEVALVDGNDDKKVGDARVLHGDSHGHAPATPGVPFCVLPRTLRLAAARWLTDLTCSLGTFLPPAGNFTGNRKAKLVKL